MTVRVVTVGYGCAALAALRTAVAELKRVDPMAPVTVIAPNNIAGIVARRHLAAGIDGTPGIAGIDVTTLARLAERIATPFLAPRRPATRTVLAAAWRRVLAEDPGRFRDIVEHPATVRALVSAHAELRDLTDAARAAVRDTTPVTHDLVVRHEAVARRLAGDWFDATDILTTAAERVNATELGVCILYVPQDLSRAEAQVATALAAAGELTVIAALTGVKRADAAIEHTLTQLGCEPAAVLSRPTASRVINASDSDDEVRCVVRDVMAKLESTPAHRIAVLYSAQVPYARVLHEQLAAAGVTVNGTGPRTVDERAVARTLLEILALSDSDISRAALFQAVANAPVRDFTGVRIPVSRWERLSRSAGVVAGDDWAARLDAYIAGRDEQVSEEQACDEPRAWLIERLGRDAGAASELRAFATRLRSELANAAQLTTWHELSTWCLSVFTTLVGELDELRHLPQEEQYAAASVVSLLRGLDGLDALDTSANLQALRDVLATDLATGLPRVGRFGEGVLVGPVAQAIGLELDVVYVVGLSEDLFPGRLRPDALLPDRARDATAGELPAHRDRLDAKQRHLLAALASARESVVSFPRGDLRRSSHRLPSRFLLHTLRALSGEENLAATQWDRPTTYGATVATAGSFAGELLGTGRLATEQEWRTRQTSSARHIDDDVVTAAVALMRARASEDLTRFDGNLVGVGGLPDFATEDRLVSPTQLESYAKCPHAYFVERILGVSAVEQPEDVVTISPMDVGSLIHESLDALVTEFGQTLPAEGRPWTDEQHARIVQIVIDIGEEFRRRGLTGHPRLWQRERDRVVSDVAGLLREDDRWRADIGARVVASEMQFGMRDLPPVEVEIPEGRVRMRGSVDKVDVDADGKLYVTDLKTGSRTSFKAITQDDPVVGGTKLQLPVYAYAARARFGDDTTPVSAGYWFVRKEPGRLTLELTPEVEQAYIRALSVIVGSIAAGLFPPKAPDKPDFSWVQCKYCNPDGIGHADVRRRWERKRTEPVLRDLVTLIEPDTLAGDE